jgi:hypothetical protein
MKFERVNVREDHRKDLGWPGLKWFFSVDLGGRRKYKNKKFEDRSRERFQANVVRTWVSRS